MDDSELRSLASLYVLGLLPSTEQDAVEAALPHHEELARVVAELRAERDQAARDDMGWDRLLQQVQADEAQRDEVAAGDAALRTDVVELLALYSTLSEKLLAEVDAAPSRTRA